jgi:hypothetical protein
MFSSLALKAALLAGLLLAGAAGGAWTTHKIDNSRYLSLELSYAKAQKAAEDAVRAEQKRLDDIATQAARSEAAAQAARAEVARRQLAEVQNNAAKNAYNLRLGFIRLLVAGSRGVDVNSLAYPTGKSANSRQGYSDADVATAVLGSFQACRANAGQLDALIAFYRASKRP